MAEEIRYLYWIIQDMKALFQVTGIVLILLTLWHLFWDWCCQMLPQWVKCMAAIGVGSVILLFVYPSYFTMYHIGSPEAMDLLQMTAAVLTLWGVGYLRLEPSNYLIIWFGMVIIRRYSNIHGFTGAIQFISMFILVCIFSIQRGEGKKQLRNQAWQLLLAFLSAQFVYLLYEVILRQWLRSYYYEFTARMDMERGQKLLLLSGATLLLSVFFVFVVLGLKKLLQYYLESIQEFSRKYSELGWYLLGLPYGIGLLLTIVYGMENWQMFQKVSMNIWIWLMLFLFLVMQVFYAKLLYTTVHLKEHLKYQEEQKDSLKLYNHEINENMANIREMKHDLKNIFLTMGEYVAKSEDTQMKEFYFQKIAPFAQKEIQRNDMYVRLQELENESLKAFLYYKIQQGENCQVPVELVTKLDHSLLPRITETSEIVRILGIFFDNALEECCQLGDKGVIQIKISEQKGEVSFQIKNPVRSQVQESGIHPGTTTKGLGRGNGLVIVDKLVSRHSDIIWNSYFQKEQFVQSITIIKKK